MSNIFRDILSIVFVLLQEKSVTLSPATQTAICPFLRASNPPGNIYIGLTSNCNYASNDDCRTLIKEFVWYIEGSPKKHETWKTTWGLLTDIYKKSFKQSKYVKI